MAETQPITIEDARGTLKVVFSEATAQQDRIRCAKLASTAFGKSLSPEGYLEREAYLAEQPLARGTGWRWWYLTLADDPKQVVAMCKTMHRDLLVRDSSAAGGDAVVRQEQGYCVCSVVTASSYRGRGLASVMLKVVAEWLDGPGNATASILYSDVGDFYVNKGWDMLDAFESILAVPPSLPSTEQAQFPKTRPVAADDIPRLCERDVASLKEDFQKHNLPKDTVLATILPTADMINWLQARIAYMNQQTHGKTPEAKGSVCESADAWLFWFPDLRHGKLTIQRAKLPLDTRARASPSRRRRRGGQVGHVGSGYLEPRPGAARRDAIPQLGTGHRGNKSEAREGAYTVPEMARGGEEDGCFLAE